MKSSLLISALGCISAAAAAPWPFIILPFQARQIVQQYQSVLMNRTYNGMSPTQTAQRVIAPNYQEVSDSILQLEGRPLGGAAATSRDEWVAGVTAHPTTNITTHDIFVAGTNNILWYWTFQNIGINKYPVKGFNLLRIDNNFQVYEADIEFNSIAWGIDAFELQQYCS